MKFLSLIKQLSCAFMAQILTQNSPSINFSLTKFLFKFVNAESLMLSDLVMKTALSHQHKGVAYFYGN